jgi:hypothetical protein
MMTEWQQSVDPRFALAVRIGVEPPRGLRLVSVDAHSTTQTIRRQLIERKGWIRGAIAVGAAALFGAAITVPAAADPAVSKTNGSVFVRGGAYDELGSDSHGEGDLLGKVTFPIGQSFGGQAEAAVGTEEYYGFGGHLFWRDPSWAMAGVFVSYDDSNGVEMTRYGGEADVYLGKFTVGGRIGQQEATLAKRSAASTSASMRRRIWQCAPASNSSRTTDATRSAASASNGNRRWIRRPACPSSPTANGATIMNTSARA